MFVKYPERKEEGGGSTDFQVWVAKRKAHQNRGSGKKATIDSRALLSSKNTR